MACAGHVLRASLWKLPVAKKAVAVGDRLALASTKRTVHGTWQRVLRLGYVWVGVDVRVPGHSFFQVLPLPQLLRAGPLHPSIPQGAAFALPPTDPRQLKN